MHWVWIAVVFKDFRKDVVELPAEHEIVCICGKVIGVVLPLKMFKVPATLVASLNGINVKFSKQVKYLDALLWDSLKDDSATQRQVKSLYYAAHTVRGNIAQFSTTAKNTPFRD